MPGIWYEPVSRKTFLKRSLTAGLAFTAGFPFKAWPVSEKEEARWAFLSDIHISEDENNEYRNFFPFKNLKKVVTEVVAARPEGVVINGDIARLTGLTGDYRQVKSLLAPVAAKTPVYMTLGNHDERDHFYAVIDPASDKTQEVENKHVAVLDAGPVRLILLDSLMYVDKTPGFLGEKQRDWLRQYLQNSDEKPVLVFVHHTLGDGDSDLLDADRMFEILKPYKKVKAVIYGHSHRYEFAKKAGIHLVNLPAIGYNFADDQPVGWVEAKLKSNGADFTLHAFGGNQAGKGKVTSVSW